MEAEVYLCRYLLKPTRQISSNWDLSDEFEELELKDKWHQDLSFSLDMSMIIQKYFQ